MTLPFFADNFSGIHVDSLFDTSTALFNNLEYIYFKF